MTMRTFLAKLDDYNRRLRAAEKTIQALNIEKDILRVEAAAYMRVSQFDDEIGRVTFKFTFPDQPEGEAAEQPSDHPGGAIIRHDAAE